MFKKILVPLDGSRLAEQALPVALTLAQKGRAELMLLGAVQPQEIVVPSHGSYEFLWPQESAQRVAERMNGYLDDVAATHETADTHITPTVQQGEAAAKILEFARTAAVDLIVMTTQGRKGVSRWLLGNTAEQILRHAPCPVLVVRSDAPIRHIMITLDGSSFAEAAIAPALALATLLEAKISFLRIEDHLTNIDPHVIDMLEKDEPGIATTLADAYYQHVIGYLTQISERYGSFESEVIWLRDKEGVAEHILEAAEQNDADTIAMSTHGRSGLSRWIFGSVTQKVLQQATGSLLIVRPQAEGKA